MLIGVLLLLGGCASNSPSLTTAADETAVAERSTTAPEPSSAESRSAPTEYSLDGSGFYRLLLAELAQIDQQQSLALHLFYEAHKQYPEDLWIISRAAPLAAQMRELDRAFNLYRTWAELTPESTQAWHGLWQLAVATNNAESAIEALREIRMLNPDFLVYIPFSALQEWSTAERADFFARLLAAGPDDGADPDLQILLGFLAADQGTAEAHWQTLAGLIDGPRLFAHYDQALDGADRPRGRVTLMSAAVEAYPDMAQFRLSLAQGWLALAEPDRALTELEQGLERNPNDPNLLRFAGELAFEKESPQARTYFTRLLSSQDKAAAHYYLGRLDERNEQWESAFQSYNQIENRNWIIQAAQRQAELLQAGHIDSVPPSALFQRQQEAFPQMVAELANVHGRYWYAREQYQRAFDTFSLGLREQPDNTDLLYMRALAAEPLSRLDDLENDLRLILRQNPNNTAALNALGYTLVDRTDRIEEAAPLIEQAYRQSPESAAITDSMGWLRFHQGEFDDAVSLLNEALEIQGWDSGSDEIVSHYVEALWASGDRNRARRVARRWLAEHPTGKNDRLQALIERLGIADASR